MLNQVSRVDVSRFQNRIRCVLQQNSVVGPCDSMTLFGTVHQQDSLCIREDGGHDLASGHYDLDLLEWEGTGMFPLC